MDKVDLEYEKWQKKAYAGGKVTEKKLTKDERASLLKKYAKWSENNGFLMKIVDSMGEGEHGLTDLDNKLIKLEQNPGDTTIQHEFFHALFSVIDDDTKKYVQKTVAELDNLLRYPGVKEILCNRQHNLNYDYARQNGEVTLVCTRRGELGPTIHKTFGLFFLLLMQFSVLKRPGTEKSRMPHFLYIDGFVDYVGPATDAIFEVYRKYKVGAIVTVQGLAQLGEETSKRRQAILANCANKIAFGNGVPEDNEWWSKELGTKTKFEFGRDYDMEKGEYTSTAKSIDFKFVDKYKPGKIQSLGFKQCFFKFKTASGGNDVGVAKLDFLPASYTAPKKMKNYEFNRYSIGSAEYQAQSHEQAQYENAVKKHRAIRKTFHFKDDIPGEVNPVQTDVSDSKFQFDNEDAIIRPGLKNKKNS